MRPQLTGHIKANYLDVCGLAVAAGHIFVTCRQSALVQVFNAEPPNGRTTDLLIDNLTSPTDLAAADHTLYVADEGRRSQCLWKLEPRLYENSIMAVKVVRLVRTDYLPYSLSISTSSRRLLVTPDSSVKALYVYDTDDGHLLQRVALPSFISPLHAVELQPSAGLASPTFVVACTVWGTSGRLHRVYHIDSSGDFGSTDSSPQHEQDSGILYWPLHVALASGNRILVSSAANGKVALFKHRRPGDELLLDRVLLGEDRDGVKRHPRRISYCPSTEQLVVGLEDEGIGVYNWTW